MTDAPLTMPEPEASSPKKQGHRGNQGFPIFTSILLLLTVLMVGVGGSLYWLFSGRIDARTARMEGVLLAVSAPITAQIVEVIAPEGALLAQGQVIARLQADAFRVYEAEARALVSRIPNMQANMQEGADRIAAAQALEEQMARRFALARHEEAARHHIYEQQVLDHVRAELYMRGLESGGRATSAQAREQARNAEVLARQKMEQAKDAFELTSRARFAVEQELRRLRQEWDAARTRGANMLPSSRAPTSQASSGSGSPSGTAAQALDDPTLLRAPRAGRVVGSLAPGQMLVRGETAVSLAPADGNQIWATAQVRTDQAAALRPGLPCLLKPDGLNVLLYGEIYDISAPTTSLTPMRVRLLDAPPQELAALLPGKAAQLTVWSRTLPGLSALMPYIGPVLALMP